MLRPNASPTLARTLRSTNSIESMISIARTHSANVKNWQNGNMALRWCAAGMTEAAASSAASTDTCTSPHYAPPEVLRLMANVCVAVRKQCGRRWSEEDTASLKSLAARAGLAQQAFPELAELSPRRDGAPAVLGPVGGARGCNVIDAVREVGFRRIGGGSRLVPIVHTKLMLVGRLWWHARH